MKNIDKKLFKLVWSDENMIDYIGYYSDEQKAKHIKIVRGKKRQIERTTKRILDFLQSWYESTR